MSETIAVRPGRRRAFWILLGIGAALVVTVVIVVLVVVRTGDQRDDGVACRSFAAGYATYASAVEKTRASGDPQILRTAAARLPSRLSAARSRAHGDVASAIGDALTAVRLQVAKPTVLTGYVDFYRAASDTSHACAAAGAPIRLAAISTTP